jgi:hypothetical protein
MMNIVSKIRDKRYVMLDTKIAMYNQRGIQRDPPGAGARQVNGPAQR